MANTDKPVTFTGMRAAIAGCGGISSMHGRSLRALGVEIAAVCDIVPERAAAAAQQYGSTVFADYTEMIDAGGFDVLHICLPHYLHAPAAIRAAEHGLHVLSEKPMATAVSDAERMIATAHAQGTTLGVIFQNRYNPDIRRVMAVIASGVLGQARGGRLRVTWHRTAEYYAHSGWRGRWTTEGGGVCINQAIHTFDLMNEMMGGKPDYLEATIANRAHPAIEVEDVAEGVVAYNDALVTFYVNTIHPCDEPVELEVVFENGTIALKGDHAEIRYTDGRIEAMEGTTDEALEKLRVFFPEAKDYWGFSHLRQIRAYYESLTNGVKPEIDGVEGIKTQHIINAIYDSAKSGKRVTF